MACHNTDTDFLTLDCPADHPMSIKFRCTCGKAYKVSEANAGRKMVCKGCKKTLRVPKVAPVATAAPAAAAASDEFEFDDDSYRDTRPIAKAPPPLVNVKWKKSRRAEEDDEGPSSGRKSIVVIGAGVISFVVMFVVGYLVATNISFESGPKEPQKYVDFKTDNLDFRLKYPEGWDVKHKEGSSPAPPWANFKDGTAYVEIKASISGSLINTIQSAGSFQSEDDKDDDLSAIAQTHNYQEEKIRLDYKEWEEVPGTAKNMDIPFGEVRFSEFKANAGFGSGDLRGYRVTMAGPKYQYNVICKCPAYKFDDYKDIFMEMIQSIGR
ncbi:MAG: hypothetical protein KDA93_19375 [Planctomycetaceae bacterium]|nr:hypothetical protein [Planctomycetaceae bacterium]